MYKMTDIMDVMDHRYQVMDDLLRDGWCTLLQMMFYDTNYVFFTDDLLRYWWCT